uniref:Uncharacterized protein n=1 Tax=Aegilops tauschii subsp. strangulata TaxID=200361 RepID=A0A453Q2P4_AEGTS
KPKGPGARGEGAGLVDGSRAAGAETPHLRREEEQMMVAQPSSSSRPHIWQPVRLRRQIWTGSRPRRAATPRRRLSARGRPSGWSESFSKVRALSHATL